MNKRKIKVGIVTIDDYTNYGNRLQNYALTKLLENEGISVINGIRVFTKEGWVRSTPKGVKRILKRLVPFFVIKNRLYKEQLLYNEDLKVREKRFIEFTNNYTTIMDAIVVPSYREALNLLNKAGINFFISGSDQVWNPYYAGRVYQLLAFAPVRQRLSFSASFGVDTIPGDREWFYKQELSNY